MSENAPPTVLTMKPAPSHSGQIRGLVPGLPPVPEQSGQGASDVSRSEMVTPSIASLKPIVAVVSTSEPFCGRAVVWVRPPRPKPPKRSPNMSPIPPAAGPAGAAPVAEQVVEVEPAAPAAAAEAAAKPPEP